MTDPDDVRPPRRTRRATAGPVFDENPPQMPTAPADAAVPPATDPAAEPAAEAAVDEPADGTADAMQADGAGDAELAATGGAGAHRVVHGGATEGPRPGKLRLTLEGIGVFVLGLVMAVISVPALQDPKQSIYEELMTQAFGPDRHGLGRMLKGGFIPTWTRYSFSGEPYAANSQHEVFYPLSLPFVLFKTSTAMDLVIALHIALAFLGMWAYLRIALRSSMVAAVFAGLSFGISSQILDHTVLGDQLDVLVWMPFVFLGIHLALERGKLRHVVLAAVFIGLQFLAGHPEEWLYSLGASVLYGVVYAIGAGPLRELPRRLVVSGVRVGGSVAMFALLFGWQLFPTLQLKGQGFRNSGFSEQHPIPYLGGVNVLLPDYGKVLQGENVAFASIVALGLFGLFFAGGQRRWLKAYLGISAALGFTMALGNQSAHPQFYNFFYDHVSLIHQFRVPSRWLLLTCFAICVGGGLGLDVLLERTSLVTRLRRGGWAVVTLAVFFGFAFLLARTNNDGASYSRWALAAVAGGLVWAAAQIRWVPRAALVLALLVVASTESVMARPQAEYRQKVPNVVYDDYGRIASDVASGGGRSLSIAQSPIGADQGAEVTYPAGLTGSAADYYRIAEAPRLAVRPNNNVAVGAESVVGRDNGLLPLQRYKDFFDAAAGVSGNLGSGTESALPATYNWPALDLLGLDYVVANEATTQDERVAIDAQAAGTSSPHPYLGPSAADEAVLAAHGFVKSDKDQYVQLWKRPAQPLFRIMHQVTAPTPSRTDRIALLSDRSFPLLTKAIVEQPVTVAPALGPESVDAPDVQQTSVSTTVHLTAPALVTLADPYYPGWEVEVDGKRAPMLAVDSAFRGVVVAAGTHTIYYHYVDKPLEIGLVLAGGTIVVVVVVGILAGRRRRRRSGVVAGDLSLDELTGTLATD